MLILVSVQKSHLFLPIGWYNDEIRIKTEVFIDVDVQYESDGVHDELENTIDYAEIHRLLKALSVNTYKLLESFGEDFLIQSKEKFAHLNLKFIKIRIQKPQILESGSDCESQFIELKVEF